MKLYKKKEQVTEIYWIFLCVCEGADVFQMDI